MPVAWRCRRSDLLELWTAYFNGLGPSYTSSLCWYATFKAPRTSRSAMSALYREWILQHIEREKWCNIHVYDTELPCMRTLCMYMTLSFHAWEHHDVEMLGQHKIQIFIYPLMPIIASWKYITHVNGASSSRKHLMKATFVLFTMLCRIFKGHLIPCICYLPNTDLGK